MTDFSLPDDAVALREGLREVLTDACTPAVIRKAWDGDGSDGLWKELGAFGLLGLLVPEDRGGLGLDELSFVAAMEECGYAGVPGPLVETVSHLPEHDLPADGSARLAVQRLGVSHVANARAATHLHREADGSLAPLTEPLPVETVDRARGAGLVRPTGDSPYSSSLDVVLDGTEPSLASLRATLGTAAFLRGLGRRQVDITVEYLKGRKQFGVAIGTFQGLKHPLAAAVVDLEMAWPVVLHAAYALTTDDPQARLRVSHAKAAASDAAYRLSRVCLQAHGAIGYTVEYDLHLFMKRTWALARDWGSADEHRAAVAEGIL